MIVIFYINVLIISWKANVNNDDEIIIINQDLSFWYHAPARVCKE